MKKLATISVTIVSSFTFNAFSQNAPEVSAPKLSVRLAAVHHATCPGTNGSADIYVDGKPPYTYQLNNSVASSPFNSNELKVTNLSPGTYSVAVRDALGSTKNLTVFIQQPRPATKTIQISQPGSITEKGTVTVDIAGGTGEKTFTLSKSLDATAVTNKTGSFTGLEKGHYELKVTDANNCELAISKVEIISPVKEDVIYASAVTEKAVNSSVIENSVSKKELVELPVTSENDLLPVVTKVETQLSIKPGKLNVDNNSTTNVKNRKTIDLNHINTTSKEYKQYLLTEDLKTLALETKTIQRPLMVHLPKHSMAITSKIHIVPNSSLVTVKQALLQAEKEEAVTVATVFPTQVSSNEIIDTQIQKDDEADEIVAEVAPDIEEPLSVHLLKNHSASGFEFEVLAEEDKTIRVKILDRLGNTVQILDTQPDTTTQIGSNYKPGSYFAIFSQGNNKKVVKLVKK